MAYHVKSYMSQMCVLHKVHYVQALCANHTHPEKPCTWWHVVSPFCGRYDLMESHFHYTTANYHRPLGEVQVTEFFGSVSDVKGLHKSYPFSGRTSSVTGGSNDSVQQQQQQQQADALLQQSQEELNDFPAAAEIAALVKGPSSIVRGAGSLEAAAGAVDWQVLVGLCGVCSLLVCLGWLEGKTRVRGLAALCDSLRCGAYGTYCYGIS